MRSQRTILFGIGLPLMLAACADTPKHNPDSPYYAYPAGMSASGRKRLGKTPA
ncbi:MAG: hypothetical protein HGA75_09835, partial [Thiobacillus sp.]|nr:hypothetical protein [Thiobacillus sp.]